MSRVDELLHRLAPQGVNYQPIGSVITSLRTGLNPRQNFKLNGDEAHNLYITVRELDGFGLRPTSKTDRVDDSGLRLIQNRSHLKQGDILFSATGTIGRTALVSEDPKNWNIKEGIYAITPRIDLILPQFMIYLLQSSTVRSSILGRSDGSTVASISMASLRRVKIPVPPLEVQREIVRILNQFTQLETKLEAELEARRRQYEHYRTALLDSSEAAPHSQLQDLVDMRSGRFIAAAEISSTADPLHPYPCYGGNGLRGYVASYNQIGPKVLIGRQGALSGNVHRVDGEFYATEHAVVVSPRESVEIDIAWTFHMLTSMNLNQYVSQGAQPGLAVGTLKTLNVALPPLDEQKRIASILDKLDAIVNHLGYGLPAELAARRKQYEYYRDRLLTFKEAAA